MMTGISFQLDFVSAFILGLFGSTHCLVMCGGLMAAMAVKQDQQSFHWSFNSGRILGYGLLGLFAGSLGWLWEGHFGSTGLRVFAGAMLIAMGLYLTKWWVGLTKLEQLGKPVWKALQPFTGKLLPLSSHGHSFALGLLWIFLPCGLIYSSLAWSISLGNPISSGLAMLFFGLGTLPAVLISHYSARSLLTLLQGKFIKQLSGIMLILYGIWTLWSSIMMAGH